MIIKGQDVNLLIGGEVVAASSSCDFSLTANTTDAAAKDDPNPMWDNAEFTYYDWSCSNESFIVDVTKLKAILKQAAGMGTEPTVIVQFQIGTASNNKLVCKSGRAIITSCEVDAPNEDYAKLNISLEGAGSLIDDVWSNITKVSGVRNKIRGKQLMLAMKMGTGSTATYQTICAATSHKLSISAQTADIRTKDDNDMAIKKEVTGYSMSLSTENLVNICDSNGDCVDVSEIMTKLMTGANCELAFGYYAAAKGAGVDIDGSWGAPDENGVKVTGSFMISSIQFNGQNKDNSTFSAEFACKGVPAIA